jgi:hypothetical protein
MAERAIEAARTHALAASLCCWAGFAVVLVCAYWVGPLARLDRTVLDVLSVPTDTLVNEVAYAGFRVVNFKPFWVLVGTVTALIALAQWRLVSPATTPARSASPAPPARITSPSSSCSSG